MFHLITVGVELLFKDGQTSLSVTFTLGKAVRFTIATTATDKFTRIA